MTKRVKIGLALGSGGARGMAHLGVLRAFQEAGLKVDVVAGTSMGALMGLSMAADGVDGMMDFALTLDWRKALRYFVEAHLPHSGLIEGDRVTAFIRKHARDRRIEELDIPFAAVATDLATGEAVVLDSGDTAEAIRASLAIPGLFTPVKIRNRYLVDGGMVNPVPVDVARRLGADRVIAVDVTHFEPLTPEQMAGRNSPEPEATGRGLRVRKLVQEARKKWRDTVAHPFLSSMVKKVESYEQEPRLLDVMGISMRIMESQITEMRFREEPADFVLRPKLGNIFFMEFNRSPEIVQMGYEAAKAAMPEIFKACWK